MIDNFTLYLTEDPEVGEPLALVADVDLTEPLEEPVAGFLNIGYLDSDTSEPRWLGSVPFMIQLDTSFPITSPQYIPATAGEHVILGEVHVAGMDPRSVSLPVHVPPTKVSGGI